jgi:lipid-binding SYLF domain-containing protein
MNRPASVVSSMILLALLVGCSTAPKTEAERKDLVATANGALKSMKTTDPGLETFMKNVYGYAIFPEVGKGGLIAGGAYGRGAVYEKGQFIGYSDVSQATIGLQAGGQTFRELIIFANQAAFDRFIGGQYSFAANASAVALKTGAASTAEFKNGVVVFTEPIGGLMFEAAIGGQQFTYQPK